MFLGTSLFLFLFCLGVGALGWYVPRKLSIGSSLFLVFCFLGVRSGGMSDAERKELLEALYEYRHRPAGAGTQMFSEAGGADAKLRKFAL